MEPITSVTKSLLTATPTARLALEARGNLLTPSLSGLLSRYSARPPQSMERLAPRHALPRAPGVLLPSLHYVALSRCFRPISRVATRTSFYLQLKAFVPQRHVASHTAGARELPAGQTSDVNGHAPLSRPHSVCPACSSCPTGIC